MDAPSSSTTRPSGHRSRSDSGLSSIIPSAGPAGLLPAPPSTRPSALEDFLRDPEVQSLLSRKSSSRSLSRALLMGGRRRGSDASTASAVSDAQDRGQGKGSARDASASPDPSRAGTGADANADPLAERERERRRLARKASSASLVGTILADEAAAGARSQAALQQALVALDAHARRATEAEQRVLHGEQVARSLGERVGNAESIGAAHARDAAGLRDELVRARAALELARAETETRVAEARTLERERRDADRDAKRAWATVRKLQQELAEQAARAEGQQAGMRRALEANYARGRDDGYAEGHEAGHAEGHAEGFDVGRDEGMAAGRLAAYEDGHRAGYDEGYAEARAVTQTEALAAFERVLDEPRTPPPRPIWLHRRVTGESEPRSEPRPTQHEAGPSTAR